MNQSINQSINHPTPPAAAALIERLGLAPHPEGGFFRETYRAPAAPGARAASTAIYFLLPEGHVSKLHRLDADEVWHFYAGGPLEIHELEAGKPPRRTLLGVDLSRDERPQHVVPGNVWFGATPAPGVAYTLVGCTVAPGFEFSRFEMGDRARLLTAFPAAADLIARLT